MSRHSEKGRFRLPLSSSRSIQASPTAHIGAEALPQGERGTLQPTLSLFFFLCLCLLCAGAEVPFAEQQPLAHVTTTITVFHSIYFFCDFLFKVNTAVLLWGFFRWYQPSDFFFLCAVLRHTHNHFSFFPLFSLGPLRFCCCFVYYSTAHALTLSCRRVLLHLSVYLFLPLSVD